MPKHIFTPSIRTVDRVRSIYNVQEIEKEPMLYSCNPEYAYKHGGDITRGILDRLHNIIPSNCAIDTKSVMLMKGMYPAIGGWHCDDVRRSLFNGQPVLDYLDPEKRIWTVLCASFPFLSNTEFLNKEFNLKYNPAKVWHSINRRLVRKWEFILPIYSPTEGTIVEFTQPTLHRASPASNNGWRYFFRCTERPSTGTKNRIRNQVQVYSHIGDSW